MEWPRRARVGRGPRKAALFQSVDPAGRPLTGRGLERRVVLAMIKASGVGGGAAALDVHMLVGYARVSKTDGSQSLDLQASAPLPQTNPRRPAPC